MKGYTGTLASGEAVFYRDRKRWFWLMSLAFPLQPLLGIWLHAVTGLELWLVLPIVINYVFVPLVDWLLGECGAWQVTWASEGATCQRPLTGGSSTGLGGSIATI